MLIIEKHKESAILLLKSLIRTVSFSGEEDETADIISAFLVDQGIKFSRINNNIIAKNEYFNASKPTILLNSHHDTVKVVNGWDYDPFGAIEKDGIIYGLGSNDAGASLVSLIAAFSHFYKSDKLPYNLILAATAEEENFGPKGMKSLVETEFREVNMGIIGEPTNMNMAIAEKGLLVIDGICKGKAGHAARSEGVNAIYKAIKDVENIINYHFDLKSEWLGENVMTVTQIHAGYQHNVVPDECKYVIDLRVNECYSLKEAFDIVDNITEGQLTARSFQNNPSNIDLAHPVVKKGRSHGFEIYGSPTLSDQAHMDFPTIKMGPGKSERSHTANEFIKIDEIKDGIQKYIHLLEGLKI